VNFDLLDERESFDTVLRMTSVPFSKIRTVILALACLILVGGVGYRLGERKASVSFNSTTGVVVNTEQPVSSSVDFSLFWDVWQRLFASYIDRAALDAHKMVYGAISGMVNALDDPYTSFLPPKENKDFKEDLGGQFEGIGAQLGLKDGNVVVIAPLKDMPAEKAGIRAGDYILKVDDAETTGWTVQEAVTKIRGVRGTPVKLTILHDNETKSQEITIVRDTITVASVESWVKPVSQITEIAGVPGTKSLNQSATVSYIHLSRFGDHTSEEWQKAVTEVVAAQRNGSKGLIFDLRNNPGGYLDGAVFIASEFVKSGIVVSQVNSNGTKEDYTVTRAGKLLDLPVIVLVNKGSASAAEIVAGALRDYKRATLVGEVTFGKGSVQTPEDLPDGSGLHITTGKWLLPKGDSIHKVGVTPDVLVPMEGGEATADAQLQKAVELLLQ
jgi:carboxyl-terminal processing protease